MTGKTHLVCGEALALCLLHPDTPRALVLCLGAAAVGGVVSDVDVTTSTSHRELVRIVSTAGAALLLGWALNTIFQLHIERFLLRYAGAKEMAAWAVLFLGLCVFGATQPHRSFMHSLAGLALLTFCVWRGAEPLAGAFFVAMASHILLDLLNRKGVRLLYPAGWSWSLDLCSADGAADRVLCGVGSLLMVAGIVRSLL
ncbi:MAG: metal-dependent hydrolase [Clostridiales bacterium]|nr:metal-dependent hydrolase [Clostridiales bacterium]MCD8142286.1 metal-dependent hydrolase [Clostridiales bacterium]